MIGFFSLNSLPGVTLYALSSWCTSVPYFFLTKYKKILFGLGFANGRGSYRQWPFEVPMNRLPAYLILGEVAEMLRVHPETVRKWVRIGQFPRPIRIGKPRAGRGCVTLRWRREALMAWLENQEAALA